MKNNLKKELTMEQLEILGDINPYIPYRDKLHFTEVRLGQKVYCTVNVAINGSAIFFEIIITSHLLSYTEANYNHKDKIVYFKNGFINNQKIKGMKLGKVKIFNDFMKKFDLINSLQLKKSEQELIENHRAAFLAGDPFHVKYSKTHGFYSDNFYLKEKLNNLSKKEAIEFITPFTVDKIKDRIDGWLWEVYTIKFSDSIED